MICWDTPFSTIPTLTYEGLREAWDDRRYIETLKHKAKEKGKEKEAQLFLDELFKDVTGSRADREGDSFRIILDDYRKMDEWRQRLADKILEISK